MTDVRHVELVFTAHQLVIFERSCEELRSAFGVETDADAVIESLVWCLAHLGDASPAS